MQRRVGFHIPWQLPGPSPLIPATALLCLLLAAVGHADAQPLYLHNHSPYLHVFGAPAPEGGTLTPTGQVTTRWAFSLANHADSGEESGEAIVLDGESYFSDLVVRYGLTERWELGLDMPYVAHRAGVLDNLIEGWHDAFGLSNNERQRPSNHLQIRYSRNGLTESELMDSSGGIGDLRLSAAYALVRGTEGRSLALRTQLKVPTGNEKRLRGSGATDLAFSLDATDRATFAGQSIDLFAQAGAVALGDGEILPDQQKGLVPFGSVGLGWQWRPWVALRAQLSVQGDYFESVLAELGSGTANIAVGGVFQLRRLGLELDVALVEDLVSDATPDFGVYASIRRVEGPREIR